MQVNVQTELLQLKPNIWFAFLQYELTDPKAANILSVS